MRCYHRLGTRGPTLGRLASGAPTDAPVGRLALKARQLLLQRRLRGARRPGRLRIAAGLLVLLLVPALRRCELPVPAASSLSTRSGMN